MEELQPEGLEELMQELEGESDEVEALSPEVEQLLRDLHPDSHFAVRKRATEQLGSLGTSHPRIVSALIAVQAFDESHYIRTLAAESLRAPVHQEILQEHPDLMPRARSAAELAEILREEQRDKQREKLREQQQREKEREKSLAPSELVLLHILADRFASTSSAAVKLGEWVSSITICASAEARPLGEMMLAAAFLAAEQAGAVHLEVGRQQALFGLLDQDKLYVVPGERAIAWPSRSFESALHQIAASLRSKWHNHVSEIIHGWWLRGERRAHGWSGLGDLVYGGLVSRGLLQKERKAGLKGLLAGASYILPEETAAMVTPQSLYDVRKLLETCRRTRPEVWDLLIEGINKGVGKCREYDWDWD